MLHIIFEGVSRTGKDTHIRKLLEFYNDKNMEREVIQFAKPPENTIESQFEFFVKQFRYANKELLKNNNKILIWNRSHLGEAVYGKLYRNWYYNYIWSIEKVYSNVIKNAKLILLNSDPRDVIGRDDGKSFSTKLNDKKKELRCFRKAFKKTKIKDKIMINISNYSSIKEITQDIILFLII